MRCKSIENEYHFSFYHHIGLWGGIWKAPNTYTINSDNANQMDVQLIKKFSKWEYKSCLLYTSPSPRDATLSRMPSSA